MHSNCCVTPQNTVDDVFFSNSNTTTIEGIIDPFISRIKLFGTKICICLQDTASSGSDRAVLFKFVHRKEIACRLGRGDLMILETPFDEAIALIEEAYEEQGLNYIRGTAHNVRTKHPNEAVLFYSIYSILVVAQPLLKSILKISIFF